MDNSTIDFTAIWQQQKAAQPNIVELQHKLNRFKKNNFKKLIISNILLITTIVFTIFIWYKYQPQYLTTKLGIVLVILAMAVFLWVYNKQFSSFNKIDDTQTINDYLISLTELKTKQKFIQTTMLSLYFIILSLGIGLYLYEYTLMMPLFWAIFAYGVTLIWIGFNWFYVRPKTIKKQQVKLDELIHTFEAVKKQLNKG
ncbi:hypothetical protein [Myroides sp. DF42-4-2]|uniref:hypothetical protein n=1 Tax=Myroides sp. DF42-4-2 TaxID=2746726 RepID=UPI0025752529|nr:hypothetical protein [Myroides sp. DF42-4-2]MDM1409031.1 hypothetical protein [Myroides sp. DF42-4-2]